MVNSCIDNTKLITASWQYKPVQFRQPGFNATISLSLSPSNCRAGKYRLIAQLRQTVGLLRFPTSLVRRARTTFSPRLPTWGQTAAGTNPSNTTAAEHGGRFTEGEAA